MDYSIKQTQHNVWRVSIASITRIVRYRSDSMTFAPWEVMSAEGQVLWCAESLESAFRWIQARTGYPAEALFAQALLEASAGRDPACVQTADESTGTGEARHALGH
ncbi:MAG: hypothetical protein WBE65_10680 [Steroidobacteraceae bacterium]